MTTYIPIDEAIDSFKISKAKLSELVAKGELKVCFWFAGLLREYFFAHDKLNEALQFRSVHSDELSEFSGYKKFHFKGYIAAWDNFFANELLHKNEHTLHDVRIVKDYGCKQITYYDEEMEFGAEYILDEDFKDTRKFQIIVENSLGHYEESSISLRISDCHFSQTELEQFLSKSNQPSMEEIKPIIKYEFEHAILKALEQLGEDPKALPKYNPKQKSGIRSRVKKILKANPKTKYLVDEDETFNAYWQDLRTRQILIDKI